MTEIEHLGGKQTKRLGSFMRRKSEWWSNVRSLEKGKFRVTGGRIYVSVGYG